MQKAEILQGTTFGKRIAEDEGAELGSYFVETEQWKRIFAGDVDVVYGAKGAGKSAIYSLLASRREDLFDRGILVVPAENPRGAPVFKDLVDEPPIAENAFRGLWKLYFLALVGAQLREFGVATVAARRILDALGTAGLLPVEPSLKRTLKSVVDYVRRLIMPQGVEGTIKVDPHTGVPVGVGAKIIFSEPSTSQGSQGIASVDQLLGDAEVALADSGFSVWLILDRLDVAFAENEQLEQNALRALFRAYLDLSGFEHICPKIFLRNDIWKRITEQGFREASHITNVVTLSWTAESLLNLVIRRSIRNQVIQDYYEETEATVLADREKQEQLFYRMFPDQIDLGPNKPKTFDWMLSRVRDGTGSTAPRELIHLLNATRDVQLRKLELGNQEPPGEALFERGAFKEGLPEVSTARLQQTLFAEHPSLKPHLERLEGEKTQQTPETLARIWGVDIATAINLATQLVEVGFFERQGSHGEPLFWVPFLYRDGLGMVQGSAD